MADEPGGSRWTGVAMAVIGSVIAGVLVTVLNGTGARIITGGETTAGLTVQVSTLSKAIEDSNTRADRLATRLDTIIQQFSGLYTRAEAVADRQAQAQQIDALSRRIERLENTIQNTNRRER